MGACVIVMGFDHSDAARLPDTALDAATAGGGVVVAKCNPCAYTRRITVEASTAAASGFMTRAHNSEELKPAETYVINFADGNAANAWLDGQAHLLPRKHILLIDPALSVSG